MIEVCVTNGEAAMPFPCQRSFKVKCLLIFPKYSVMLRSQWHPLITSLTSEDITLDEKSLSRQSDWVHWTSGDIQRSLSLCLRSVFFFFVALCLHDHFTPKIIPTPSSPSTWRPCLLQMDFSCFIEIPNVEVRGTLIKMSWEDESGGRGVK